MGPSSLIWASLPLSELSVLCPHSTSQQYPASAQQRTIRINKSCGPFRWKVKVPCSLYHRLPIPHKRETFPISPVLMEPASVSIFITTSQSNQFPPSIYNNNIHFQWLCFDLLYFKTVKPQNTALYIYLNLLPSLLWTCIVQKNKMILETLQISWERSEAQPGTSNIRFEINLKGENRIEEKS